MTARITVSCDGHRHGGPCRGALHTRWLAQDRAHLEADAAGWRVVVDGPGAIDLCPSPGHDEEAS